ncbi:MAG TPA: Clp protease N-terminal domain-containing protein [Pyrinomonadaceae bacterium]|nr:Clp protease N-terminal domain-containing protein [Pyrinomonadaceae bacterium]
MKNSDSYLEKLSESGRHILEGALDETRRREQYYVSPEHILYALMTEETDLFFETRR